MKDIEHILRVAATFVIVISLFLIVRSRLVPESFGKIGHYRAAAVDETKALPVRHAGQEACAACHAKLVREKAGSSHRGLSCETCHGASQAHAENPADGKVFRPPGGDKERNAFCSACHAQNVSRPPRFPQVNIFVHNPGMACTTCHDPHRPKL